MAQTRAAAIAESDSFDPITLEIVKNALASIADEMALVILRSAFSPIVRDSMDYSTAVCDYKGRVVAQGLTNPIHLGSFPTVMANIIDRFGASMAPGDGFITNDPYGSGGMHLPDIYLIRPIFLDQTVEGYSATLVHHTDVGGMAPGSMALHAVDIFQEGLRIPLMKIFDRGEPVAPLFDLLRANSRMPDELMGDFRAQVAAGAAAERGYLELLHKYGATSLRAMVEELHNYAERLVRNHVRAMPDGVYCAQDFIDGLGEGGEPIRFSVSIIVAGDAISIDWTGTSDEVKGAINGPIATTYSVAYAALRATLGGGIPNCEGYTRPVTVKAPLGSIVNPRPPAACAARGVMAYRMFDALFAAFAQIAPDRIPAGGEGGPSAISLSGLHNGAPWLITDGVLGSWGGRSQKDGVDGVANPGANLSNQPIELIEARLPLRVEEYGLAKNSGGAGRYRGGLAVLRSYRVLSESAALTVRSDRRRFLPEGLFSGNPGSPSLNVILRDGLPILLPVMPMETIALQRNDLFLHIAAGGAGHGKPLERDARQIREDALDGKISRDFARDVYGVVLADDLSIDEEATAAARRAMKNAPLKASEAAQMRLFFAEDERIAPFCAQITSGN